MFGLKRKAFGAVMTRRALPHKAIRKGVPIPPHVPAPPGGPTQSAGLLTQILPSSPAAGWLKIALAPAARSLPRGRGCGADGHTWLLGNTSVLAIIPAGVGRRRLRLA